MNRMKNTIRTIVAVAVALVSSVCAMAQTPDEYIYFDLAAGNVQFIPAYGTYGGYVYVNGTPTYISGTHNATNRYYIYQSSTITDSPGHSSRTGYASQADFNARQNIRIPDYDPITGPEGQDWGEYSTNNTDVVAVRNQWVSAAENAKRTSTQNYIQFLTQNYNVPKYDIILDNVWSEYYEHIYGRTAAMTFDLNTYGEFDIKLKNYSKLNHIKYDRTASLGGGLHFTSIDGDGAKTGSLVVTYTTDDGFDPSGNNSAALIGGIYNLYAEFTPCYDLNFDGGTVYVGLPNYVSRSIHMAPTAIGGGANYYGEITISGGVLTAIASTTGATIGGGGGTTGLGSKSSVSISGGKVYAYNFGLYNTTFKTYGYSGKSSVAGTAIGGGSTEGSLTTGVGGDATVTISGGYVYAQSVGGNAIGGGNSSYRKGGNGTVTITGGTVVAKSVSGNIGIGTESEAWSASTAIGGGTGGILNGVSGGDAVINISGNPTIKTGSIGGGKTNNLSGRVGTAQIDISGNPTISGQFVLAKGAAVAPKFKMVSGMISNSSTFDTDFPKVQPNGGAVYIEDGSVEMSGGTITGCTAGNGGAYYVKGGTFTVSGTAVINGNTATKDDNGNGGNGGGLFVEGGTVNFHNGRLTDNTALNGGGLFLASGASMTFNGGIIKGNHATASSSYSGPKTAYAGTAGQEGFGGGFYLQSGTTSNTNLTIDITGGADFGIYDNSASTGADDILAEGTKTSINIPDVKDMQLAEFTSSAYPNWYEDYNAEDNNYDNGLKLHSGCTTYDRFVNMLNDAVHYVNHRYLANGTAIANKYLNLKLGYEILRIIISATGLNEKETAYYQLIHHEEGGGEVSYPVLLLGDGSSKVSKSITGLPWGNYSAILDKKWTWAYDVTVPNADGRYENIPIVGVTEYEFPFTVEHKSGDKNVLHDEEIIKNLMLGK